MSETAATQEIYSYSKDGRELTCATATPPRRFDNMVYNDAYFGQIDQTMRGVPEVSGRYMSADGYVCNVVADERIVYVRDDDTGEFFSAGFMPVCKPYTSYRCTQGLNYQTVENVTDGLQVTWRLYVPSGGDPVEIWDVRVCNLTGRDRRISLVTEIAMECDGVDLFGGFLYRRAAYNEAINGIVIQQDGERHLSIDFPLHNAYITADRTAVSWCTNRAAFTGPRGLADPVALKSDLIPQQLVDRYIPTGALQVRFTLAPNESGDTRFLVGACDGPGFVGEMRRKYLGGSLDSDLHFDAVARERSEMMQNIAIRTPDDDLAPRFNTWIKHQIHFGTVHGRWGYKGFRDIVQQAQGILTQDPLRARSILRKACAHQYQDGFALRGWHPIDPMRYADSAQWMIGAVTEYLKETGDFALLEEEVPFYDDGSATLYEHLNAAMARLHEDRGAHGLCKIFFGDWNDSLTGVGREGRGESVWLSMAFCRDALLMAELAHRAGRPGDAQRMRQWHAEMKIALNKNAWDGAWYLCALDDNAQPIGSNDNHEGRIFLNMQSWAQLGRVCSDDQWGESWRSVKRHLDTGWGLKLNWPTYTRPVANVGRMSYMRPGTCENGSVYTHGNAFMLLALLERGLADDALDLLKEIDPCNPARPTLNQPNLYFNGYLGPDALAQVEPGKAEHVWCTGSAAWLFFVMVEYIMGLRRTYDGIVVQPCLPSVWKEASITRTYRGTTYEVVIRNPDGESGGPVASVTVDGTERPAAMPLPIDGGRHDVVVTIGRHATSG